jgi:hypothetical protein
MAFQILSGRERKTGSTVNNSCSLAQIDIQTLAASYARIVEKSAIEPL